MITDPKILAGQVRAIQTRIRDTVREDENIHFEIANSLNKLRAEIVISSPIVALRYPHAQRVISPIKSSNGDPPYPANASAALVLCDLLLAVLEPAASNNTSGQSAPINRITPESRTVFIVHGHDEANLLRLRTLLTDRFGLHPVILMDEPSSGQTVIEKFERTANEAAFCFVLMTPDDQVKTQKGEVTQARPNVIFELGWFYGRLGRSRVCILCKRATAIHSDLSGIVHIEFIENVEEAIPSIEKELRQAKLIG